MRYELWLALLPALIPVAAEAQQAAPVGARSSDSAAVVAAVEAYDAAWATKDTAAAGRWLAPKYQYFSSVGALRSRDHMLAFLVRPDYRLDFAERTEVEVTLDGETAVVSSRWRGTGAWSGGAIDDDQRCGQVFVRREPAWQVLSEHCVQITE
jgi:hypothetical protein